MTRRASAHFLWRSLPWLVIGVAILFRVYALGRLPGVNGDEAWYGVQAQRWVNGEIVYWRTPSGNLPGPLQLGWLLLLQWIFEPSFALLRIPSLIASLGAMVLAWAIGRRFFDRTTATIALLLMATLPVNIAYARFGWDTSHLGLVILTSAYAALAGRPVLSALAFALALAVHPTAAFAGPFLMLLMLGRELEARPFRRAVRRLLPYAAMLVLALGLLALTTSGGQLGATLSGLGDRLLDPATWAACGLLFERLLTGETVYSYITGRGFGPWRMAVDVAGAVLVMGLAASAIVTLRGKAFGREAGLVAGWLASLMLFFLIAGPGALQPHFERYAVWLVAPSALAFALLIRRLISSEMAAIGLTLTVAMLLLAGFWSRYVMVLEHQGSRSASAFWTGPVEPKQAAYDTLAAIARAEGSAQVIAEDWWLYWPVAYLAAGQPLELVNAERRLPTPRGGPARWRGIHWLVYRGSPLERRIAAMPGASLIVAIDATGHPRAIRIWWTPTVNRPDGPPPPARR